MQLCGSLIILWHCLSLRLEWKRTFSSPVATAEFSKLAGILSVALSPFRIWNSSTGIPSPPLALFVVMLSKAHLTSHSRRSGSMWVITTLWLSGSLRSFSHSSFVYSWHLFWISFASIRAFLAVSVLYCTHPCMKFPLESPRFLKRSLVFPMLLFSSVYLHWSLRKAFLSLLAIVWNSAFRCLYLFLLCFLPLFFSQLFVRPPQTPILLFHGDGLDPCLLYNVMNLTP